MKTEKKEKILSALDKIIGIFLVVLIFTIPFRSYKQTTETICFFMILFAFIAKVILSKIKTIENPQAQNEPFGIMGTPIDLHIFIFTVFIVISLFFSVDYLYSLKEFKGYWLMPVLLFYFIVNFANNQKKLSYIIYAVVIASLAPILLGLIEYFTMEEHSKRLYSLFAAPTEFGQYLDYIIPFIFALLLWNKEKFSKIFLGLILAGAFFCLLFTYTRASWVGIFIVIMFLSFMKNKKLILIFITIILLLVVLSPQRVKDRVISMTNEKYYLNRICLFENSMDQIKKKPFTGYGWGYHNFHHLYPFFVSPELKSIGWTDMYHAHNYSLQMAFEIGILGSVVFLWLWITTMILTWKSFVKLEDPFLKSVAIGIFASFIACSIHWLVEIPDAKQLIMTLWAFIGLSMAIFNITKKNGKRKLLS